MSRMARNPDVVSGAALIVFGAVATSLSLEIPRGPEMQSVAPNFVPLLCSGGIVLSGVWVLVRGLAAQAAPLPKLFDRGSAGVGVLIALYYWFFEQIDFRLGTWVFILGVMLVMGCRNRRQLIVIPLAGTATIYLMFRYLFEILLPTWG